MGGCISSVLANFFLGHHEKIWLDNCPLPFKPKFYRRYVDDTFLLFENESQINQFLTYLNSQHNNIKFTVEIEKKGILPFLDISVSKSDSSFITNSFQKKTFSGLGMKFDSAIPEKYKYNLINCLVDRAFKINSSSTGFFNEIRRLKQYFCQNNFPLNAVDKTITCKINSINSTENATLTAPKKKVFATLPFLNKYSNYSINKDIQNIVHRFYPSINLNLIFQNNFSIDSFFPYKDKVPTFMLSNLVYKFSCELFKGAVHFRKRGIKKSLLWHL